MMVRLIGKERLKYFSKRKNADVDGYVLHFFVDDPRVEGIKTKSEYVDYDVYIRFFDVPLDTDLILFYNDTGKKCVGCTIVNK